MNFMEFCTASDEITAGLDPVDRIDAAARLLSACADTVELQIVTGWLERGATGRATPRPTVGTTVQRRVYDAVTGETITDPASLDHEIFDACRRMAGGTLPAIRLLLEARQPTGATAASRPLADVDAAMHALMAAGSTAAREEMLIVLWETMWPVEIYWLHQLLSRAVGARPLTGTELEQAIARFSGAPLEQVRYAVMLSGDVGRVAVDAVVGVLDEVRLRPMQPLPLMRAVRVLEAPEHALATMGPAIDDHRLEPLLPCVRVQAHRWDVGGGVSVFAGDAEITARLPHLAADLRSLPAGTVLDGGLILVGDDGALTPSDVLATSLHGGGRTAQPLNVPPLFVAFDVIAYGGEPLLAQIQDERRRHLERICSESGLALVRSVRGRDVMQAVAIAAGYRRAGASGLMLKRDDALYAHGSRDTAWQKIAAERRRALAVVRYASFELDGTSPRVAEITLGLWRDVASEPRMVNICRVPPPPDSDELTARLLEARVQRFGTTWEVRPTVICTVGYDDVRTNARAAAGCLLTAASIVHVHDPGTPLEQVTSVESVLEARRATPAALDDLLT